MRLSWQLKLPSEDFAMVNRYDFRTPRVFLTAEWKNLAMLNYEIDPAILTPHVPHGTELDEWDGKTFVSVVGFQFLRTRVFGVPIPFHRNFEEVNLHFYVRHKAADGWRRGVVFVKEIVPRAAIATTARRFYNEPYIFLPMGHCIEGESPNVKSAEYWWGRGRTNRLKVHTRGPAQPLAENSEAEYITEHYWGYNTQHDGSTLAYQVEHPRWRVYEILEAYLACDVAELYGEKFSNSLSSQPSSAFLAEGSVVKVYQGVRIH